MEKGADVVDPALFIQRGDRFARATFPRLAQTVVTGRLLSTIRIVASTMAPPLLRSATMRSASCARYAAIAIFAHSIG